MARLDARTSGGVVGLDLSLRRTAMVHLPDCWDPAEPGRLVRIAYEGYPLREDATEREQQERRDAIASAVLRFCEEAATAAVYSEDHAWSQSAKSGIRVAELHGCVKDRLFLRGGPGGAARLVEPVPQAAARAVFLGRMTKEQRAGRGAVPAAVQDAARAIGIDQLGSDAADGFVVANFGASLLGRVCVTDALPPSWVFRPSPGRAARPPR